MNMHHHAGYIASVVAITAMITFAIDVSAANIERSCKATYLIHMGQAETESRGRLLDIADVRGLDESYAFSARRGCGSTVPNRCRQRASEAALQCMQAHSKNPHSMPTACKSNGVENYSITDLDAVARERACRYVEKESPVNVNLLPKPYYIGVTLKLRISGDEGCGGGSKTSLTKDLHYIRVSCPVQ